MCMRAADVFSPPIFSLLLVTWYIYFYSFFLSRLLLFLFPFWHFCILPFFFTPFLIFTSSFLFLQLSSFLLVSFSITRCHFSSQCWFWYSLILFVFCGARRRMTAPVPSLTVSLWAVVCPIVRPLLTSPSSLGFRQGFCSFTGVSSPAVRAGLPSVADAPLNRHSSLRELRRSRIRGPQ